MMNLKEVSLSGGGPWGFRINSNLNQHKIKVARVNDFSKASEGGLRDGDILLEINGQKTSQLDAAQVIKIIASNQDIHMTIQRGTGQDKDNKTGTTSQNKTGTQLGHTSKNNEQLQKDQFKVIEVANSEKESLLCEIAKELDNNQEGLPILLKESNEELNVVWSPPSSSPSTNKKKFKPINFNIHETIDQELSNGIKKLPKYPSPTVTLLQKAREGTLPKGAHYIEEFSSIGPVTPEGVPLNSKSTLTDDKQHEWYKRMYDNIHKEKKNYKTHVVKYSPQRSNSNKGIIKSLSDCEFDSDYGTLENTALSPGIRFNSPGKIKDYTPGHNKSRINTSNKGAIHQWANRELGYESDSYVVHKNKVEECSLSEQRQRYLEIQKGGEVPIQGLRKTNQYNSTGPQLLARYNESSVNIHYTTPVRLEEKEFIKEDELRRREEMAMTKFYQEQRQRKFREEILDQERRRHSDHFVPSQKSPIPLNRYDEGEVNTKVLAKALFNFQPQNRRELGFEKGCVITIRRKLDANWFEGELDSAVGIFPSNYVKVLTGSEKGIKEKVIRGTGKYDFIGSSELELTVLKGESVIINRKVDDNWYEGRIGNRTGIFPVNYIQLNTIKHQFKPNLFALNNYDPLSIDTTIQQRKYRALYNYSPCHNDELELEEDDLINVLEKCDDGWFVGTNSRTGLFGTFPGNYVTTI